MNRKVLTLAILAALSFQGIASAQTPAPASGAPSTSTSTASTATTTTTATSGAAKTTAATGTTTTTAAGTATTTAAGAKSAPDSKSPPKNYALSLANACHSEGIVLADYVSYNKGEYHWNDPPKTFFRITKILKGPPLNKDAPVRFEFHDHSTPPPPPPSGWKFSPDMMPKKGEKFILFIEHAVPHNGMFETYQGSYGRYEATEDNLNAVYEELNKHNQLEERER